jgi:branched-chain amino acid transport system permease protein
MLKIDIGNRKKMLFYIVLVALLLSVPLFIKNAYIMHLVIMTCVWGVVVNNWNLTLGYGGMFHIAQITLFAVGGYMSGIFINQLMISPWLGLLIGGIFAALMSLVIGLPALRVKGIYLILLTFVFHYGVKEMTDHFREFTGGSMGLSVAKFSIAGVALKNTQLYYVILAILALSLLLNYMVVRSYIGKALMAIRDSDVLANSTGINPYKFKLMTFVMAAFVSGVAGAFYASYLSVIGTEIFSFSLIVNALGMIVIGGMGTLFGPIVGSFIITFFMEIFSGLEDYRPILVGSVIILVLLFAPNGLIQEGTKRWDQWKKHRKRKSGELEVK